MHKADKFKLNIYFDPMKRGSDITNLSAEIEMQRRASGFYAIATLGMDMTAMQTWELYGLRDEQEKYFQQMKSQLGFDRQRNWSEEGKTGRLLILFVGLILSSNVHHIWKSTDYSGINVPLVAVCNVPPVAQCNVPPQKWLQ